MAERSLSLDELICKLMGDEHANVLRDTLAWFVGELMEAEAAGQIGAGLHERSPERVTHRNGYRERLWQTRAGEITLAIARLPAGTCFPRFLEPGEKALVAVMVETEAFWREFLGWLRARGLAGTQLCVSDAHEGLRGAIAKMLGCPWQRCTVHFLRDMLGHCSKEQQPLVSGAIRQIFAAENEQEARTRLGEVPGVLGESAPKLGRRPSTMDDEVGVKALFARAQAPKTHTAGVWSATCSTGS
jgi:transposase-like protein